MLLKTLMPCYFRSGWKSRALGTEGQAFGAVSLSWLLFHELQAAQQTQVCFSPPALCTSYLLVTRDNPRWKKKGQSSPWPNPASLVMIWKQRGLCVLVFKATWRALFATQNFWNGEFMNTSSNNYMENILFFFIKHMHMPLCWVGFLSFFHGQCCVSVDRETPNSLHTSTLELRFLWRRWPRFKYITLLIGSFLVALYLVGNSFLFLMYT